MPRALPLLILAACNGAVTAQNVERVVVIGDNVASNPTLGTSYASLFEKNDDAIFPEFAGKDLRTRKKDVEVVRLDRGGDSYQGIAANLKSLCTCVGDACKKKSDACLDSASAKPTLLIVELGVNDLIAGALRLLSDGDLRADPAPLVSDFRRAVRTVLKITNDKAYFSRPPLVYVTNVYDPSDGQGDIVAIATKILPLPGAASEVTPEMVLTLIDAVNTIVDEEAAAIGASVIDVHGAFLGHGLHHDDADDPTTWIRGFIDPNLRGAHELRRLLWQRFTGEAITVLPSDLPADNTLGLPEVPDDGWAQALVEDKVARETTSPSLGVVPNNEHDATKAIGKTDGEMVALGVVGNYLVLDFGFEAQDGDGPDIVVMEMGPLSGGVPEPYRLSVSEQAEGPFIRVGDGAGEQAFDLGDVGLHSARYVKIESLAQPSDIGRVGSPSAPGGEIDSVGAVWPAH